MLLVIICLFNLITHMSFRPQPVLLSNLITHTHLQNVILILFIPINHLNNIECILSDTEHSIHTFIPNRIFSDFVGVNNVLVSGYFIFLEAFVLIVTEITFLGGYSANCIPVNVNNNDKIKQHITVLNKKWPIKAEQRDLKADENQITEQNGLGEWHAIENLKLQLFKTGHENIAFYHSVLLIVLKQNKCSATGNYGNLCENIIKKIKITGNEIKKCISCFNEIKTIENIVEQKENKIESGKNKLDEKYCKENISQDTFHTEIKYYAYSDTHIVKKTIKVELVDIKTLDLLDYIDCKDDHESEKI